MKRVAVILGFVSLAGALLLLSGCGRFLDPGPPAPHVLLVPDLPAPMPDAAVPVQVTVPRPETGDEINTDRIAALFNGFTVKYLANARWASPVPAMFQRLMIESLETAGYFSGVGGEGNSLAAQLRLNMDIRRFYLRYDAAAEPVADIAVTLRLTDTRSGSSLGVARLRASRPARSEELRDLVDAFNAAVSSVLQQARVWVFERAALLSE